MLKDNQREIVTTGDVAKKVKVSLSKGRGTLLLMIIGIAVSLTSSFMFCLTSIGFDFTQLHETVFWSRWASMALSSLCAYGFVILHKDDVNRQNKWYVENLKALAEKSTTVGERFEEYLKELNLQRRIEWFKRKMSEKIGKLNQKLLRLELKNKNTQKVEAKIEKYKKCITEDFIEQNKSTLKTRSKPISSAQVLSETQRGDNGEVNFRSVASYYGGKAVFKLLLSLVLTMSFACVVVNSMETVITVASVAMVVLTVLSLLISCLSAVMAANGCYKNIYVPNLLFKLKILSDFDAWKEKSDRKSVT